MIILLYIYCSRPHYNTVSPIIWFVSLDPKYRVIARLTCICLISKGIPLVIFTPYFLMMGPKILIDHDLHFIFSFTSNENQMCFVSQTFVACTCIVKHVFSIFSVHYLCLKQYYKGGSYQFLFTADIYTFFLVNNIIVCVR